MSHLVSHEAWGDVDLIADEKRVFVQENWFYTWTVNPGATGWTIPQKRHFHNSVDRQIWKNWSDRLRINVAGVTPLARKLGGTSLRLTLDIHWVLHPGHWWVQVRKLPPGSTPTTFISNVSFATRQIQLDSADLAAYSATNAAGASRAFYAAPHEFGHTLSNSDEYNGGLYLSDTSSIMNIGNRMRSRHVHLIVDALSRLAPGCTFTVT